LVDWWIGGLVDLRPISSFGHLADGRRETCGGKTIYLLPPK
jgi:hypothetical protein